MTVLWDTTALSRIHWSGATVKEIMDRAVAGDPVRVAAPAVVEVAYGLDRVAASRPAFATSLRHLTAIVSDGTLAVVPFDGRAGLLAGRLRARAPTAPAPKRHDRRSKLMRHAAWLLDIQIAATAFAAGLDIATRNIADFEHISALLSELYPQAQPLVVAEQAV